jgi:hypothetical protein
MHSTGAAVDLAFAGITILFDIVEMILYCTHKYASARLST